MKKIIFIDVDGTLVDISIGINIISDSTKRAIRQAKENGHLVFVCSGRSLSEFDEEIRSLNFDGYIGAAGGFVYMDGKMLYHKKLSQKQVEYLLDYFERNKIEYYLESNEGVYGSIGMKTKLKEMNPLSEFPDMMQIHDKTDPIEVNKVSFLSETLSYEKIDSDLNEYFDLVKSSWTDESHDAGEISIKGITKGSAIQYLFDYLHIDCEDSYAIGDSMNDIEMFKAVHTSIAMGNSMHNVFQYVDFVTKSIDDGGIEYALKHFELI